MSSHTTSRLDELLNDADGVIDTGSVLRYLTRGELRWRQMSGRWQIPCRGIAVAHSGPLTDRQLLRVALLSAGPSAVLAGLTAARLDGLKGFNDSQPLSEAPIHVLVPQGYKRRSRDPRLTVVVHVSRLLEADDIHPSREPRRTRIARSVVDAAAWMPIDRGAIAVLAAATQQHLVRVGDLAAVAARNPRLHRRKLISVTLHDIAGGAQALSELDFTRLVIRRFRLPEPDRQAHRRDSRGRRRYLDAVWEKWKVAVEIDGAVHLDALQYWDDMERDIDLTLNGYRTLRFPAFLIRSRPDHVAAKIRLALQENGWNR